MSSGCPARDRTATTTLRPEAGSTLEFAWFADAGTFPEGSQGDTVTWKAPDDPGAYALSVHITDGNFIGIGNRRIGVGMFAPTTTPFFLGDVSCMQCHQSQHDEWSQTGHSHAWASLQESGHAQEFCNSCHTIGYEPEAFNGNSGYDEAPIQKFVNVQCENCHLAGSEHIAGGTPDPTQIVISYEVENCGKCHQGQHHPYQEEWENSPHNFDAGFFAVTNPFCQGCHEGVASAKRLSGDVSQFYGSGSIPDRPSPEAAPFTNVTCQTCHDPHNAENPGQLRTVADVPLVTSNGESPVITIGGTGKLCMHCHHARRAPDNQVIEGYAHFGPHANPQADMMAGKSAYQQVAPPDFVWADPSHLNVQNSCKTCHLDMQEFRPDVGAITGHTFLPKVEACASCHGQIASFDDIRALDDFDGDGQVEGVQSEVEGLMKLLEEALLADGLDTTGVGFEGALGDTSISTFKQRESGYNWAYVHDDKSKGIHNPDYAVQLLQQSILHLTGSTKLARAKMIEGKENQVVAKW